MAQNKRNVKRVTTPDEGVGVELGRFEGHWYLKMWRHCLKWMDTRPRLGWYLATLMTLDVVLHLLELVK